MLLCAGVGKVQVEFGTGWLVDSLVEQHIRVKGCLSFNVNVTESLPAQNDAVLDYATPRHAEKRSAQTCLLPSAIQRTLACSFSLRMLVAMAISPSDSTWLGRYAIDTGYQVQLHAQMTRTAPPDIFLLNIVPALQYAHIVKTAVVPRSLYEAFCVVR